MNSDDLAFFAQVADAGSLSAAALAGGCDASTVSRRIAQLEHDAGARLFTRSGRGVDITPQGELLLRRAHEVAALLETARVELSQSSNRGPDRIRIAAQPTIAKMAFGALFHAIRAKFLGSQIHFTEALADKILVDLQAGTVDLAILYRPNQPGSLPYEPVLFERLYLLAAAEASVDEAELRRNGLAGIPLVLPSTHHGIRRLVQAMALRRGHAPLIAVESDSSIAITLDLVRQRCGCTVLPLAAASGEIEAGHIKAYALEGDDVERCVALVQGKTQLAASDQWILNAQVRETVIGLVQQQVWPGARLAC